MTLIEGFFEVERPTSQLVVFVRSEREFCDLAQVREVHSALAEEVPLPERVNLGLLVDWRLARGRNDPEFEQVMSEYRPRFMGGFNRLAILLASRIGALQVERYLKLDGLDRRGHVFTAENEAVRYLAGWSDPPPRSSS